MALNKTEARTVLLEIDTTDLLCPSDTLRLSLAYLEKFQTQLFLDVFNSDKSLVLIKTAV